MGYQRIWNAAARHRRAHAARSSAWQTIRAHAGDSAIDWPFAARGDGSGSAGRAYRMARLRRDSSGWRNAHGVYHGSVRGAGAGIRTADRGGNLKEVASDRYRGGHERG